VNAATNSYQLDMVWYADSGATDHIIGELDKVTMRENYGGHDQGHTTNGGRYDYTTYWSIYNFYPFLSYSSQKCVTCFTSY
jgi:hypothetical protein